MNKKFYEMPESEVIELELNSAILAGSPEDPDKPEIIDGDGDTGDLG